MSRNQIVRTVALLFLLVFLYLIRGALLPILLGVVLYYILGPLAGRLTAKWPKGAGLPRDLAIVIAFAVFLVLAALLLQFIIPPFSREFGSLGANSSHYLAQAKALFRTIQAREAALNIPAEISGFLSALARNLIDFLAQLVRQTANSLLAVLSRSVYLVITPIIVYFLLRDDKNIFKGVVELAPRDQREISARILKEIDGILRNYIIGQAILCTAVGVMCGAGCWLLGVRFALVLGVVAAIAQLIPNIGPLLATLPAMGLALIDSPLLACYVAGLYLAVSALTIGVLAPKVLGGRLNLHPLTVAVSIVVFGELMGVWGFFLAAPIVATIKALYLELRNP
ncbi:MAG: AI-2E family transporter [Candidatus Saganbacteria bacterium]|nr:AI-2E family transporter [Candidatus Saganbacteria bacterium]